MDNNEILKKLEENNQKIDELYQMTVKVKNYFKWTLIITVVLFIVPLIGLLFVIPSYLKTLTDVGSF